MNFRCLLLQRQPKFKMTKILQPDQPSGLNLGLQKLLVETRDQACPSFNRASPSLGPSPSPIPGLPCQQGNQQAWALDLGSFIQVYLKPHASLDYQIQFLRSQCLITWQCSPLQPSLSGLPQSQAQIYPVNRSINGLRFRAQGFVQVYLKPHASLNYGIKSLRSQCLITWRCSPLQPSLSCLSQSRQTLSLYHKFQAQIREQYWS